MRICFSVKKNIGYESELAERFSPAPEYVITDSRTKEVTDILDIGDILRFGTCDSFDENGGGFELDAVITPSISNAMLAKFKRAGVDVFIAERHTISENIELIGTNGLTKFPKTKENHEI